MTQIGQFVSRISLKIGFFGVVFYWVGWVFIVFWIIGFVIAIIKRRSGTLDIDADDIDELDD